MENGTPQLVARDLRRSFRMGPRRIEVLRGISMEVRRSEAVFLVGASVSGKTTLLYTLAGLERPEEGTVEFEGQRLYTGSSQAQAHIRNTQMGFVFQSYFTPGTDGAGECDAAGDDWRQSSRKRGGRKFTVSWFGRTAATFAGGTLGWRAAARGDRARSGK